MAMQLFEAGLSVAGALSFATNALVHRSPLVRKISSEVIQAVLAMAAQPAVEAHLSTMKTEMRLRGTSGHSLSTFAIQALQSLVDCIKDHVWEKRVQSNSTQSKEIDTETDVNESDEQSPQPSLISSAGGNRLTIPLFFSFLFFFYQKYLLNV